MTYLLNRSFNSLDYAFGMKQHEEFCIMTYQNSNPSSVNCLTVVLSKVFKILAILISKM